MSGRINDEDDVPLVIVSYTGTTVLVNYRHVSG